MVGMLGAPWGGWGGWGGWGLMVHPSSPWRPPPLCVTPKFPNMFQTVQFQTNFYLIWVPAPSAACTTMFGLLILPLLVVVSETVFTLVLLLVVLLLTYHTTINSLHVTNGID